MIERLRETSPEMTRIFTEGGCYQLYQMLNAAFPGECEAYCDPISLHVYTRVGDMALDIHGPRLFDYLKLVPLKDALPIGAEPESWAYDSFWSHNDNDSLGRENNSDGHAGNLNVHRSEYI